MSMGVHHPYHLDLCVDDEEPFQLIIRPEWDAPHVRCFSRTFCAWPCLLRQVGTVLVSPYDCVVASLAYANPGSRQCGVRFSPLRVPWRRLGLRACRSASMAAGPGERREKRDEGRMRKRWGGHAAGGLQARGRDL